MKVLKCKSHGKILLLWYYCLTLQSLKWLLLLNSIIIILNNIRMVGMGIPRLGQSGTLTLPWPQTSVALSYKFLFGKIQEFRTIPECATAGYAHDCKFSIKVFLLNSPAKLHCYVRINGSLQSGVAIYKILNKWYMQKSWFKLYSIANSSFVCFMFWLGNKDKYRLYLAI